MRSTRRGGVRPSLAHAVGFALGCLTAMPSGVDGQASDDLVPTAHATVLAGSLNVRDSPSLNGQVVGSAARGETLCVIAFEGDWAEIVTPLTEGGAPSRIRGYVSRGFVSEARADAETLRAMGCGPALEADSSA